MQTEEEIMHGESKAYLILTINIIALLGESKVISPIGICAIQYQVLQFHPLLHL